MLTSTQTITFLLMAMLLTSTPGPDNLMVLSVSLARGRRAGLAFGLGCAVGCLSHTVLAVVGIGALLAASPMALTVLKSAGGLYLMYLGVQALRHAGSARSGAQTAESQSSWQFFMKGLVANAINPKVVLFFLSFLPQFVVAANGHTEWQLGLLGGLFSLQAALIFGLLAYFSGKVGVWLNTRPSRGLWLDRLAGTVFLGLGARMLASR